MKKIFKHIGLLLTVVMMGGFTACQEEVNNESADLGLGIKVFFPTKVVAGQEMTINGSGFLDAVEVVFPENISVTDFEIVSNDMIRVTAPAGIAAEGGNIAVATANDKVESRLPLTLGKTFVSGFSKQPGEKLQGGEQLTVYGTDLEFIDSVELIDEDGAPLIIKDEDFYRKGTSSIIFTIPQNIFTGTFVGKMTTFDGLELSLPELAYEPAPTGHWEVKKTSIWKGDGSQGAANWNGIYRFGLEGNDGNNECIATIPQEQWDKMKADGFYLHAQGSDWVQMRITTGWWSTNWTGADITTGNELIVDNGDGTYDININFNGDPILDVIDAQHILFTGSGFTPLELYFQEEVWVENGSGPKEVVVWEGDGSQGAANWNGIYRFGLEGNDGNNECIATIPQEQWDKMKADGFYLHAQGSDWVQMRITTGWWSTTWTGADITTGNELIVDNGDGTYDININFSGDPILDVIDAQHILFTGSGFTPLKIYYYE